MYGIVRMRKALLQHVALYGLASLWTVMLALDAFSFLGQGRWNSCCIAAIEIASLWLLAWRPCIGIPVVTVLWCASAVIPIPVPNSYLYVGMTVVGILGYLSLPLAVVYAVCFMAARYMLHCLMATFVSPWGIMPTLMMLVDMMLIAGIGVGVRIIQQNMEERNRWRVEKERLIIASNLHDVACNDLVYALLVLQQSQDKMGEGVEGQYSRIANPIEDALSSVRSGIQLLRTNVGAGTVRPHTLSVQKEIERQKQRVHALGFEGLVSIGDSANLIYSTEERIAAINGLLHELFGNLVKYADHAHPFVLAADIQGDMLYISWCNACATSPNIKSSSGSGMAACARVFNQCGGTFTAKSNGDSLWCVEALMPVLCPADMD